MMRKSKVAINNEIKSIILAKAVVHSGLKAMALRTYQAGSITTGNFTESALRTVANSMRLCKLLKFDETWGFHHARQHYTVTTPSVCTDHYIDAIVDATVNDRTVSILTSLVLAKPALIRNFHKQRVAKLPAKQAVRLLASWHEPRVVKIIIEKNIRLDSDARETFGEMLTMSKLQGEHIPDEAERMFRLLA
jgi:hypothetical protein